MKNNPVQRIKLLMSYDSQKTLNENVKDLALLNENDIVLDEGAATAREISKMAKGEFKGVGDAAAKEARIAQSAGQIMGLGVDEVKIALASEEVVLRNIDDAIKSEYVGGSRIGKGQVVGREVEQASKQLALRRVIERGRQEGRVLTADEIQAIVKQTEQETAAKVMKFEKDVKDGKVLNPKTDYAAKNKKLSAENRKLKKQIKDGEFRTASDAKSSVDGITINNTQNFGSGGEAAAATREDALTAVKDANTKAVAEESAKAAEKMKPTTWEKWKKWSKEHPNSTKLLYFLGFAAGAWAVYKLFFGNTNPKEVKDKTFTNCAGDLLEVNGTKILTTKSGDPVVSVPTTGNQDYDSHKGLMFYPNNRVFLGDQSKRGTWGCNGSNVAVQAEQTTGIPGADMGIGMLNRIAVNKQLNKQKTGKTESASSVLNRISITWDSDAQSTGGGQKQTEPQPVVVPQPPIVSGDTTNTTGSTTGDTTTTDTTTTTGTTTGDTTNQTNAGLASMIKTSDNKPQEVTPEIEQLIDRGKEIYTRLYDNYNAEGQPKPFIKKDGNRLKYKGKKLGNDELNALNQYIKSLGYSYMKQKDKKYIPLEDDVKYVWEKNRESEVQEPETGEEQPETQAQEPTQLSEDFIKKIVSKHLRSKL